MKVLLDLIRTLLSGIPTPRIDGLDCDCGGSDCDCSDCNASDCGDSCKAADISSAADSSSDVTDISDSSGSSSDRRARDASLIGGAAAGAAVVHHRKKKGQRNAADATDEDLADIPRCQRVECRNRGQCDCGGEPYGKRPVRIRLRKP